MKTGKRILIVDDERRNRSLLEAMVKSLGHEADTAEDGTAALAKLQQPVDFDLLLLDIMMPGLDGFDVARRIRQDPTHGDLPIVMVTALDEKSDRLKAVQAGANDFISKPVDKLELSVRIESLLKMKEAQDQIKQHRADLEVTCRQQSETLQELLMTSAKIVQAIPCGLLVYQFQEPNELFLVNTNPEAVRLTGITTERWRGQELDEMWPNARMQGLYQACLKVMKTGEQFTAEAIHFKKDEINRFFRIRAFPMPGNLLGVAVEDLTDLVRAEETLRKQEAKTQPVVNDSAGGRALATGKSPSQPAQLVSDEEMLAKSRRFMAIAEMIPGVAQTYAKLCQTITQSAEGALSQVGLADTTELTTALGRILDAGRRGGQLADYVSRVAAEQPDQGKTKGDRSAGKP